MTFFVWPDGSEWSFGDRLLWAERLFSQEISGDVERQESTGILTSSADVPATPIYSRPVATASSRLLPGRLEYLGK